MSAQTAYAPWKQKYLARDGCCRIYCQPSAELHPDMLRPAPAYSAPGTTKETLDNTANTSAPPRPLFRAPWAQPKACPRARPRPSARRRSVNNAISFVLYNEALFQFVQWFSTEPEVDLQVAAAPWFTATPYPNPHRGRPAAAPRPKFPPPRTLARPLTALTSVSAA